MGWFNKEFVNPGKVNHKLWDIYSQSYKNRQESDYLDFVEYSKEEIEQSYSGML